MDNMGHGLEYFSTGITYKNILDLTPEEKELVRLWRNSEHVRLNMLEQEIISMEQHLQWLGKMEDERSSQIVRVAFLRGAPFGVITLKDIDRHSSRSDWGMYIGEKNYLGKDLARPMLFDLLVWGFEEERLERLYTSVLSLNTRALGLYLEAGFHIEGRFERHILSGSGEMADLYWIAMFRDIWKKRKSLFAGSISRVRSKARLS